MVPTEPFEHVLNTDSKISELSTQVVKPHEGIVRNNDQLLHDPKSTSKKLPVDDEEETLPSDENIAAEAIKNIKRDNNKKLSEPKQRRSLTRGK